MRDVKRSIKRQPNLGLQLIRQRQCNLCQKEFEAKSLFERYCRNCRKEKELLKFYEWISELDLSVTEKLSA